MSDSKLVSVSYVYTNLRFCYTLGHFSSSPCFDSVPLAELATTVIILLHIQQRIMNPGCSIALFKATLYAHTAMTCWEENFFFFFWGGGIRDKTSHFHSKNG